MIIARMFSIRYADALRYVPEELKTFELCLVAVQGDSDAIGFVPEKFKAEVLAIKNSTED